MFKKIKLFIVFSAISFSLKAQLYINEISQGPSGSKEYVEFVVAGRPGCNAFTTFDLRGWIFDDNNGIFEVGTNAGITPGCFRFSNDPIWSTVKIGTVILIYNNLDRNALIPPDNLTGANCQFIIPITNTQLINSNTTSPSGTSPFNNVNSYSSVVFNSPTNNWQPLNNTSDTYCTVSPTYTLTSAVSWNTNNNPFVNFPGGGTAGRVMFMTNAVSNNPTLQANWTILPVAGVETPGSPNNLANATWINGMSNNCQPHVPLSLSFTSNPATCSYSCNGSASITAANGYGGYTYTWNTTPSQNTTSISGLCQGSYTVTVTDTNNCSVVQNIIIDAPDTIQSIPEISSAVCTASNGSIVVHASGGTQPYTFLWNTSPAQSDSIISQLAPRNYSVTITDTLNCFRTFSYSLSSVDSVIEINSTINNVLCNGGNTGSISISMIGGTASYSTIWNNNPSLSGVSISNLTAGNYSVSISDANGCIADSTFFVNEPLALTANTTAISVSCFNGNNGTATTFVNGGTTPYNFSWNSLPVQNSSTATNLSAGTYTVNITDSNNCSLSQNINVLSPDSLYATAEIIDAVCSASNGNIVIHPRGGTPAYTYLWSSNPVQTDSVLLNVTQGNYSVVITDANNCTKNYTYSLTAVDSILEVTATINEVLCNGGNNGSITLSVIGGTLPYSANWTAISGQSGLQVTNLTSGNYQVTVSDANGCSSDTAFQINEPTILSANVTTNDVTCFNGNNGSAQINAFGGTSPYTFLWNTVPTQSGSNIAGFSQGNYSVTITDFNNCTANQNFTILSPDSIHAEALIQQPVCTSSNGSILLNTSGGTAPYTFLWNNVGGTTGTFLNNISSGTYSVIITDVLNCQKSYTYTINNIDSIISSTALINNVLCFGGSSGAISLTLSGGSTPYSTIWNNNPSLSGVSISNLTAGSYTVSISDINGCTTDSTYFVTQPSQLTLNNSHIDVSCFGGNNGSATVLPSGGTSPYTFTWNTSPFQTDSTATNLTAGNYIVNVTDLNGCSASSSVIISQPTALTAIINKTDEICGQANGSATITPTGGAGIYSYSWTPNVSSSNSAANLISGNYSVVISDQNSCTTTTNFTINNVGNFTINPILVNPVTCFGSNDGSATVIVSGGLMPFNFSWTTSLSSNDTAYQLSAGVYSVTVTDANGCIDQDTVRVTSPLPLVVDVGADQIICNGSNATLLAQADGGNSGAYQFSWNTGQTIAGPFQVSPTLTSDYIVSVTDIKGCVEHDTITINIAPPISADIIISGNDSICLGESLVLNAVVGGSGNYTYNWTPSGGNNSNINVSPTSTTTYYLSVSDNCTTSTTDSIKITVLPLPNVSFGSSVREGCSPLGINFINLSSASINCFWEFGNGQTSTQCQPEYIYNEAGIYDVALTVTNSFGCSNQLTRDNFITVIPYPEALFVNSSETADLLNPEINFYDQSTNAENWNWYIDNNISSSDQNFTYTFSDTGNYQIGLVVSNRYGCADTAYKLIKIKEAFNFYLPNSFTPDDNILNDIFMHKSSGLSKKDFEFLIFDRWGNIVFSTNDVSEGWNGKLKGLDCPDGVYVYKIKCRDINSSPYYFQGIVTLIR